MQLELPVQDTPTTTEREDADLAELLEYLRLHTGWHLAADILEALGKEPTETNKRRLRRLSEQADGLLISGQKGYRCTAHATAEEIHHAAAWLDSLAIRVTRHATEIRRAGHRQLSQPITTPNPTNN